MFSKVDVKQKDSFLEQTKAQREERAYERQKEIATLKIQVHHSVLWFDKYCVYETYHVMDA